MNPDGAEKRYSTDILVIGGGMGGFFAAIKAKERGMDVILADKAYVGKTGGTHYAEGDILSFRPDRGHKLEEWMRVISERSEYINNRQWDEICLKESKDRYDDLVSWGIRFYGKEGEPYIFSGTGSQVYTTEAMTMLARNYAPLMRKTALEKGVRVFDRIMFCELLVQDGMIVGAVGFHTTSGHVYVFEAKATIVATGSSSLKSGTYPVHFWTGDGEAMAYRAGAEIVGKEFMYGMAYDRAAVQLQKSAADGTEGLLGEINDISYRFPFAIGGDFSGWYNRPNMTSEGGPVILPAWEAHCGRAPLYLDLDSMPSGQWEWLKVYLNRIGTAQADKIGLDVFKAGKIKWPAARIMTNSIFGGGSGIWPTDGSCASSLPGLYAAGNSCGTMASGAMYASMGFSLNHAAVTGARSGIGAAEYASKSGRVSLNEAVLSSARQAICEPVVRKGGFSPGWLTQVLQGITVPYFILSIKHEERLRAALTIVEFLESHIVPKIVATGSHEWRMAHETRNMILIAEMRLRASLFRTESRGNHFREDYPQRDDPTWLAWVKLKEEQGRMKLWKEPIPRQWWPDLSKPLEVNYPRILPME